MSKMRKLCWVLTFCATVAIGSAVQAATLHSETTQGDISGNRTSPTVRTLVNGSNDLFATSQGGDQEYLRIIVPTGLALRNLFLRSDTPQSFDQTAFIAMASGSTFASDPNFGITSEMLGYTHFSPFNVGQDLFPAMRSAFGVQGFNPPLPAGTYSFFIQQQGTPVTYQMDFFAIPEPSSAALIAAGTLLLTLRRRHWRIMPA